MATGLDALEAAGFSWAGTAQFWSFVCRINGLPTPDDDPCVRTPPADAYWSYWTAPRGGAWSYESQSAGDGRPGAGLGRGLGVRRRATARGRAAGPAGRTADAASAATATHRRPRRRTSRRRSRRAGRRDDDERAADVDRHVDRRPSATTAPRTSRASVDRRRPVTRATGDRARRRGAPATRTLADHRWARWSGWSRPLRSPPAVR